MKKLATLCLFVIAAVSVQGQKYVLDFDGVDDYVDLGADVGDGIRTIELWFKPNTNIDTTLSEISSLVWRDCCGNNIDEFELAFMQSTHPQKGKLRFNYLEDANNTYTVASDTNFWYMNQWYHVAAVIDPSTGMSLYIDGLKQAETNAYSSATTATGDITAIGRQGFTNARYFNGRIEDVRFSTTALYSSNFAPPCPDIVVAGTSQGVWNFNEGTGTIAIDSTSNGYDGTINGATYVMDSICFTIGINEKSDKTQLSIYPNPTTGQFTVQGATGTIEVYDLFGRLVLTSTEPQVDMSAFPKGVYIVKAGEAVRKLVVR